MKNIKTYKTFKEGLDPMGSWKPDNQLTQTNDNQVRQTNKLQLDDIQIGDSFIDRDDEIVKCVDVINTPTNFSLLKTLVGDNDMCYGYGLDGWDSAIKSKISNNIDRDIFSHSLVKKDIKDEKTKWFIEYGLGGGFGNSYEVVDAYNQKEADDIAYQRACEEYDSHAGGNGIRDIGEIMEEDEVDDEEAAQIFNEERESWLDYQAVPYDPEKHDDYLSVDQIP